MSDDRLRQMLNAPIPLPRGQRQAPLVSLPPLLLEDEAPPRLQLRAGALAFVALSVALCVSLVIVVATGSLFSKLPYLVLALMGVVVPARLIERAILAPVPLVRRAEDKDPGEQDEGGGEDEDAALEAKGVTHEPT